MRFTSRCNLLDEERISGTPERIVKFYEKCAYEAERAGQIIEAQLFFNYAEHYKRVGQ